MLTWCLCKHDEYTEITTWSDPYKLFLCLVCSGDRIEQYGEQEEVWPWERPRLPDRGGVE